MIATHSKKFFVFLLTVNIILPAALIGCGDSQGVTTLNACLSDFSELVENYKTEVNGDQSKQADYDAKVAAIIAKWTDLRGEYGSDITPHHMDKMVQKFDSLLLALTKYKKTLGS